MEILNEVLEYAGGIPDTLECFYHAKDGRKLRNALGIAMLFDCESGMSQKEMTIEEAEKYEKNGGNVIVAIVPDGMQWAVLKEIE